MKKLLLPLMVLLGLGLGVGAGLLLRPALPEAPPVVNDIPGEAEGGAHPPPSEPQKDGAATEGGHGSGDNEAATEFVKLNNQFIVPVISKDQNQALMILSMSLEVTTGESEKVFAREPKLRDAFLQILFDHANAGGFDGNFTSSAKMDVLRAALLETAQKFLGPVVSDVLIVDIVRQES